jgi:hypothetical protein
MASPYQPPPVESATDPVHSPADLCQRWRALMGPLGFGERLLWFAFVGPDRRMIKAMHQIPIPLSPKPSYGEQLFGQLREVLDDLGPRTTVALLVTRPGIGPVSNVDRRWATMLTEAARRFDVPIEPIFRANDASLVLVEPRQSGSGQGPGQGLGQVR